MILKDLSLKQKWKYGKQFLGLSYTAIILVLTLSLGLITSIILFFEGGPDMFLYASISILIANRLGELTEILGDNYELIFERIDKRRKKNLRQKIRRDENGTR